MVGSSKSREYCSPSMHILTILKKGATNLVTYTILPKASFIRLYCTGHLLLTCILWSMSTDWYTHWNQVSLQEHISQATSLTQHKKLVEYVACKLAITKKSNIFTAIYIVIASVRKFSIVIGSPRAFLSRNRRAIM